MEPRQPKLIIVTGGKGSSKSTQTITDLLTKYSKKRRILIVDINNDEYGDWKHPSKNLSAQVKRIAIKDIPRFSVHPKIETRRIILQNENGTLMDFQQKERVICETIERFRNGALVLEDLNTVFGDALPVRLSGLLCNNRQRNTDVFIHLQSVGRILPKMLQNANMIRMHKQLDALEHSAGKLGAEYEMFKIAYTLVENQYAANNIYYSVWVDRDYAKIRGAFTKGQLKESVEQFISDYPNCLKTLSNKKDKFGKSVYDYPTALRMKTEELLKKYG